jgi:aryl carrier-like protein
MTEKATWQPGTATLIGGGLDSLMILAALERIEERLAAIHLKMQSKKKHRRGPAA